LSSSYSIKAVSCELCKCVFPDHIKLNGIYYDTWEFASPKFKSFITFESIPYDKNSNRTIFTVNMETKANIKIVGLFINLDRVEAMIQI